MATWYDSDYAFRIPLTYESVNGTSDGSFSVPADWDEFWSVIQSDGDDIRVCGPDGKTLLAYEWSSFTYASRSGTIVVDADLEVLTANYTNFLWLYWGNATAVDGSTATTIASAETLTVELTRPVPAVVYEPRLPTPGVTAPELSIQRSTDGLYVMYIRLDQLLSQRTHEYEGHYGLDAVFNVFSRVEQAGSEQTTMTLPQDHRLMEIGEELYYRMVLANGSDANDYTIVFSAEVTRDSSTPTASVALHDLELRILLYIRNIDET